MADNINVAPYYDDYDASKGYLKILALPGRVEQAREFTQIQSMFLDFLRRIGDSIMKNGSILEGCGLTIQGTSAKISSGKLYLNGIVYNVGESSVTITGLGNEIIGAKTKEVVITEVEDYTLRDPAQGYDNYNQAGAHRLKTEVQFTVNDSSAVPVFQLIDGGLQILEEKPQLDVVSDLLARRTHDESGNYKVRGLGLVIEPRDTTSVTLTVEAGKAYIMGYEVNKPTPFKVNVAKALDVRLVANEPKVFLTATASYKLNNRPVRDITKVVAQVEVTENVTRGSVTGGVDFLPKAPVIQILEVKQGATSYNSGIDYQLTTDGVDWSLPGNEPSIGSTYSVRYRYNKTMVPNTDYKLTSVGTGDNKDFYIDFSPTGDDPVNNTTFLVDYNFYLARKDLVSLDQRGNVIITKGQSEIQRLVSTPGEANPELLRLGTLYFPPNSDNVIVNSYAVTRLSQEDLQRLVTRINDLEYNMAISDLDKQAMEGEAATNLKGIFTDGFIGTTKADLTHPDFSAAFSFESGQIVLPSKQASANNPIVDKTASQVKAWGRLITAPVTEVVAIEQKYATEAMLVNPYNVFNKMAVMSLSPAVDNWVDYDTITVEKTATATYNVHRWWYHGGETYYDTEKYLFENLQLDAGQSWGGTGNFSGNIRNTTTTNVLDEATQYMRVRDVSVTAQNLIPNTDNLEGFFDGQRVTLTPAEGYSSGTVVGSVRANPTGVVKFTFAIPTGVRCGTREFVLKNSQNTAAAAYTANGRKRTVEQTVLTTRVTAIAFDPLAQSFQFDSDRIISSVGLYFAVKDPTLNVTIQIRDMVNGYPGQTIYGETVLTPSQVNVSANGAAETKVSFNDPILCKAGTQYCAVVLTDSDKYQLFVAELGAKDLPSGAIVTSQPYLSGTLFSSANAITWTAHQTKDMKFKIYAASFAPQGVIEFSEISGLEADRVVLMADYLTPLNTGCAWELKVNEGAFQPLGNYDDIDLSSKCEKAKLRASFKATGTMSPIIASDSFTFVSFLTETTGSYISRNVDLTANPYTTVRQVIEAAVPSGCSVVPKFTHDGTTWITGTLKSTTQIDNEFAQYVYEYTIESAKTNFRARLDLTAPNQLARPKARKFMNVMK
ncbi:hypothetical protein D3C74_50880 [compost metagenome]